MKRTKLSLLVAAIAGSQILCAQDADTADDDDIFELSPFVVQTEEQMGYTATSTLAGTRIKTELKDVGASVSVYTEEFLNDIDGQSLEQILTYTTNSEVAGIDGNFSGAFAGEGNDAVRTESSSANRIRGLAPATSTRNYFTTDIPFDSYNSNQLTIVRGPNAVLAGAGAPGGLVDGALRNAVFRDDYQLSVRYGKNDTYRAVLNVNEEVIEDRLAVRVDILGEERNFRQEPAFERDERIFVATNLLLRKAERGSFIGNTRLRASYENGTLEGVPPNPLPPVMSVTGWFDETEVGKWSLLGHSRQRVAGPNATGAFAPNEEFAFPDRPDGYVEGFPLFAQMAIVFADPNSDTASVGLSGDLASVQGFQGVSNPGGGFFRGTGDRNRERAGYSRTRLLDRNIFDFYNNLMTGNFDYRTQDFDAFNIALEQVILDGKAGLEFVYDSQNFELFYDIPISGGDTEVFIDVNKTLSVKDNNEEPIPNPNFSRPFIVSRDAFRDVTNDRERETYRLTAFVGHDFRENFDSLAGKLLGRHTLSGLYQSTENDLTTHTFRSSWNRMAGDYDTAVSVGNPGTFRSQVNAWFYIGDPLIEGSNSVEDIRLIPINTERPVIGQTYDLQIYTGPDRTHQTISATPEMITSVYRENKEEFESLAYALQSHWLNEYLITLISYREDTSNRSIGEYTGDRDTETNGDLTREEFVVTEDPELTVGSWTKSVVAVFPEEYLFDLPFNSDLRFFWNESENFTPSGARRNIYNEDIGPPRGETEEFGFNLTTFNGKLDLKVTWYETKVTNQNVSAGGNPYAYIQAMATRLVDAHNTGIDINDPTFGWDTFGFNSYIDAAQAFLDALPEQLATGEDVQFNPFIQDNGDGSFTMNSDQIPQLASISDTVSDGVEIEAIFNPLPNWRISLSIAKQEAIRAGVAANELEFAETFLDNMRNTHGAEILQASRNPAIGNEFSWIEQYNNEHIFDIRAEAGKSGAVLPEVAEWRANLVTRYTFRNGPLKRFHIGGAMRWIDSAAIGYPVITNADGILVSDLENPYYGDEIFNASFNCGYRKNINLFGQKVDWSITLWVSNVIGTQDLIVTKSNPDGSIGQVRIPPERFWSITNNFRF